MATGQLCLAEDSPSLLIVASSSSQAEHTLELARQLGFIPDVVGSGKEALLQIEKQRPQIILTDCTLPDMDAKTFAHDARKAMGTQPVIIISYSSDPEVEESLLAPDVEIDDFVLKSSTSEGNNLLAAALLGGLR
jgi:PleD family two-component response regulator